LRTSAAAATKPSNPRKDSEDANDNDNDNKEGQKMIAKTMMAPRKSRGGRKAAALMRRMRMTKTAIMMTPCQTATIMLLPRATIAHHPMEYPFESISNCYVSIWH
jgi:hypothetical protein